MKFSRATPFVLSVIAFQSVSAAPLAPSAYYRRSDVTARDTPRTEMVARDPVVTLLDLLTSGSDLSRRKDDDDDDDSFNLSSILDMVEKAVNRVDKVKTGFKDVANEFKGAFKGDGAAKVIGTTTVTARDTPHTEMVARDPVVTLLDLLTGGSDLSRRKDDDDDDDSFSLSSILDMVEKAVNKVDEVKTGFKDVANEFKGAFKGDGAAKVIGTTTVSST